MNPRINTIHQLVSAYEMTFENGAAKGKSVVLVHNHGLEVMFSKTNALDIEYVKFNGKNISFLSKNGINEKKVGAFVNKFEGGFLYTCGLETIGLRHPELPQHGSLHNIAVEDLVIEYDEEKVVLTGVCKDSALFGQNLWLRRRFEVYKDKILVNDTVENHAYVDGGYVLLYHTNFGYPFLNEDLEVKMDLDNTEAIGDYALQGLNDCFKMSAPIDGGDEQCYYHNLKSGKVELTNKPLGIKVGMAYDTKALPITVEWKSMVSGDYALGIEPVTARFDDMDLRPIKKGDKHEIKIAISFEEV